MVRACWLMSTKRTNVVRNIELGHVKFECKSIWWKKLIFTTKPFYLNQMQKQLKDLCVIVKIISGKNEVLIQGDFNLDLFT